MSAAPTMTRWDLEDFLTKHDLSNDAVATLLGVTPNAVDHWLKGRRDIPKPIAKLVQFFNNYPDAMKVYK